MRPEPTIRARLALLERHQADDEALLKKRPYDEMARRLVATRKRTISALKWALGESEVLLV